MLNQSFSAENFRKIFDFENRKGNNLSTKFFPEVEIIMGFIKNCNIELKALRKSDDPGDILKREELIKQKELLIEQKEVKLEEELNELAQSIVQSNFKINLEVDDNITDKTVYKISKDAGTYFTTKQVQYNIRKLYKVKQSDRFAIVNQVKTLLDDCYPKKVFKTDISQFYETIPHERLLDKLNKENLLTFFSRKIITQILKEYSNKTGNNIGIPRGVGISSYLAELYMRDVDRKIKELPGVYYYARYVDDIVVMFMPTTQNIVFDIEPAVTQIFSDCHLTINRLKTKTIDLTERYSRNDELEYLGYKFVFGRDQTNVFPVKVFLTQKKIEKIQKRIDLAFKSYRFHQFSDERKARQMLIWRVRFLTSNVKLANNKRNVLTGIYYSNSGLTEVSDLSVLDDYLNEQCQTYNVSPSLYARIKKYSFLNGFQKKVFSNFSTSELSDIMKIWK